MTISLLSNLFPTAVASRNRAAVQALLNIGEHLAISGIGSIENIIIFDFVWSKAQALVSLSGAGAENWPMFHGSQLSV